MIFSNTSNYMLKYQKAKAKLVECDIPRKDYPKFPLNSNELSYPVVYILSRYAESVIENNVADMEEFSPHLVAASQYFDAAVGANDREEYDVDFLLSGAAAYFLSDDFGSAKGGKLRRLYIPKRLRTETLEWLEETQRSSGFLFLNRYGERITTRGISQQLKNYADKYGLDKKVVYPHSFRHRYAKNFLEKYNDIALLADLMGHESIETTRIYLRRTASEQQALEDKIVTW